MQVTIARPEPIPITDIQLLGIGDCFVDETDSERQDPMMRVLDSWGYSILDPVQIRGRVVVLYLRSGRITWLPSGTKVRRLHNPTFTADLK